MKSFAIDNPILDAEERLPRTELKALQVHRLRETVTRALKVPFYRKLFKARGITPDSIQSLDDVRRLPFTTKQEMRVNNPLGLCAGPRSDLARIHGSSGTTGKPTFVGYTRLVLKPWSRVCARFLVAG